MQPASNAATTRAAANGIRRFISTSVGLRLSSSIEAFVPAGLAFTHEPGLRPILLLATGWLVHHRQKPQRPFWKAPQDLRHFQVVCLAGHPFRMGDEPRALTRQARVLRRVHAAVGIGEIACLGYVWVCALARRRDRWVFVSVGVLGLEGVALVAARGCPLGIFQRRAGDDVPMFELWFGPRLAPFAIPAFSSLALLGTALVLVRSRSETQHGVTH